MTAASPTDAPPELFTTSQLESHAARIAATHAVSLDPRRARPLLPRLDSSGARLDEAYLYLSAAGRDDPQPPATEAWLRDNHHVVQDQVRDVRQHLPRQYYLELPKLADGPLEGFPRVYLLARELITHTAGRLDLETVVDFTRAYQRTAQLTIGEIWAVPIMIRLALVEELHRLADRVVAVRRSRVKARAWYPRLAAVGESGGEALGSLLADGRGRDGRI